MVDDDKVLVRAETRPEKKVRQKQESGRALRIGGAIALVAAVIVLALAKAWPFNHAPPETDRANPTIWQFLLDDRVSLGIARLAFSAAGLFAVLSIVGLIAQNRWLRNFLGLKVDDPGTINDLREQLGIMRDERDEALAKLDEALGQRDEALDRVATLEAEQGGESG